MVIPEQELQELAKKVVLEFCENARSQRDAKLKKISDADKHYRVQQSDRWYDGRAQTADSTTFEAVETIVPRMLDIVMPNGQLQYAAAPENTALDERLATAINALISSDLKKAKTPKKILQALRDDAKQGTIVVRTPWRQYTDTSIEPQYEDVVIGVDDTGALIVDRKLMGYERIETVNYAGVDWELVDLNSIWLDPIHPDMDDPDCQGIVEEQLVAFEELQKEAIRQVETPITDPMTGQRIKMRQTQGHYFNLDAVRDKYINQTLDKPSVGGTQSVGQTKNTPRKLVKAKHYHGYFDFDGDGKAEDCIISLVEDDIVIRLEPTEYPLRPYIVCRYLSFTGETWGMGVGEALIALQKQINGTQDQALDNVTMALLNMWKALDTCDLEDSDFKYGQNKVFRVGQMDEIEPIQVPYVTRNAWDAIAYMQDNMKYAVGAPRSLQGIPMKYHTTATEVTSMTGMASMRIVSPSVLFEQELFVPLLMRIILYNRKFMDSLYPQGKPVSPDAELTQNKLLKITGDSQAQEAFLTVTPEDLKGQYRITLLGAAKYARMMKLRQELMSLVQSVTTVLQVFATNPQMFQQIGMDVGAFLQEIVMTHDIPNIEKIFPNIGSGEAAKQIAPPQGGMMQGGGMMSDGGNGAMGGEPSLEEIVASMAGMEGGNAA